MKEWLGPIFGIVLLVVAGVVMLLMAEDKEAEANPRVAPVEVQPVSIEARLE